MVNCNPMWLIDSSYKLANEVKLKLNVGTTLEDTHTLNNDVENVFYLKQSIPADPQSGIHLSTEHMPIALEQLIFLTQLKITLPRVISRIRSCG